MGEKKHPDYFIDVLGHDINNLNHVILAYLELLQESNRLDDRQNRFLENAIVATKDCANLVRSVKAVRLVSAGYPEARDLDLDRMLRECIRDVPRPAGKKVDIRLSEAPPRNSRLVRALPELKLAFTNVIGHSIRHSGREVCIEFAAGEKTAQDGRRCFVTAITDDGYGISDEIKRTLFENCQAEMPIPSCRGLGLYTAKMLAEAFGGSLELEDRVPGDYRKGTKVTITLPAAEGS
jgi:signal transduction histidine kinase